MHVTDSDREAALLVGVDGGGTSCRARIVNRNGRTLGSGTAGPAAVRLGIDQSLAAVEAACLIAAGEAGLQPSSLSGMFAAIGLAGIGRKGVLEELNARPHPFRSAIYVNDATIACLGAHNGQDGGIVIVGTGSVGLAIIGGREVRIGGYGFPVSDEGSGADLGLRALRCTLQGQDGRETMTGLTREIMARFGDDPFEVVAWMDRATATDYATLAPLVIRHAKLDDRIALRIMGEAAGEIDALVRRLIACGVPRVALLGGLSSAMEPWLAGDVRSCLTPPEGDAVDGALHLARREAMRRA
jgi:glucosamine kinase